MRQWHGRNAPQKVSDIADMRKRRGRKDTQNKGFLKSISRCDKALTFALPEA
jgi:hypothetical protein